MNNLEKDPQNRISPQRVRRKQLPRKNKRMSIDMALMENDSEKTSRMQTIKEVESPNEKKTKGDKLVIHKSSLRPDGLRSN